MNNKDEIMGRIFDIFHKLNSSRNTFTDNQNIYAISGNITEITKMVHDEIFRIMETVTNEKFEIIHYGANYLNPAFLVFWVCVRSDKERDRLKRDAALRKMLRKSLDNNHYPEEGRDGVVIDFESQETVNRKYGGDWQAFFK
ncbi:MAG: hypothetical protein JW748_00310 [Anaerolineales bacterium]|nr:hypothetical protein [Anaerolineales bacterium]